MNRMFENQKLLVIAGAVLAAIVIVLLVSRLAFDRPSGSSAADHGPGRCSVARKALEAFDQGRAPPPEWIQDRAAAAEAVRTCDRP